MDSKEYIKEVTENIVLEKNSLFINEDIFHKSSFTELLLSAKASMPITSKEIEYAKFKGELILRYFKSEFKAISSESIMEHAISPHCGFFISIPEELLELTEEFQKVTIVNFTFSIETTKSLGVLLTMVHYHDFLLDISKTLTDEQEVCIPSIHPQFYITRPAFNSMIEIMTSIYFKAKFAVCN